MSITKRTLHHPCINHCRNFLKYHQKFSIHQSPRLLFATTSGKTRRLELDASHEEIFPTGRARIGYERDLTLKDKLRANKKLEKEHQYQINNHKYASEMYDILSHILHSTELEPARVSWSELDFTPPWFTTDKNSLGNPSNTKALTSLNMNDLVEVDLLKVGFELHGVILPSHRQYIIVYWGYNPLCAIPGGIELTEKIIALYRQTLRAVIAQKMNLKHTPRLFFKYVKDPNTTALHYKNKMENVIKSAASERLNDYIEFLGLEKNPDHFDKVMEDIYGDWSIGDTTDSSKISKIKHRQRAIYDLGSTSTDGAEGDTSIMMDEYGYNNNSSSSSSNSNSKGLKNETELSDIDYFNRHPNGRISTSYNLNSHYKRMILFYQDKVKNKLTPLQRKLRQEKIERRRLSRIKKKKEKSAILSMILSTDPIYAQNYGFDENENENEKKKEKEKEKEIDVTSNEKEEILENGIRLKDGNIMFLASGGRRPKTQRKKYVNTDSQIYLNNETNGEMKNVTQKMTFGYKQDLDLIGIANEV